MKPTDEQVEAVCVAIENAPGSGNVNTEGGLAAWRVVSALVLEAAAREGLARGYCIDFLDLPDDVEARLKGEP